MLPKSEASSPDANEGERDAALHICPRLGRKNGSGSLRNSSGLASPRSPPSFSPITLLGPRLLGRLGRARLWLGPVFHDLSINKPPHLLIPRYLLSHRLRIFGHLTSLLDTNLKKDILEPRPKWNSFDPYTAATLSIFKLPTRISAVEHASLQGPIPGEFLSNPRLPQAGKSN